MVKAGGMLQRDILKETVKVCKMSSIYKTLSRTERKEVVAYCSKLLVQGRVGEVWAE